MDRDAWRTGRWFGAAPAGGDFRRAGDVPVTVDEPPAEAVPAEAGIRLAVEPARLPILADVELVGTHLRASGLLEIGGFTRLSDYLNHVDGFFQLSDVILLTRTGVPTRVVIPELRVRLDEIALVGQREPEIHSTPDDHYVPKRRQRLLVMTAAHIVSGFAYLHEQASVTAFIDADDPPFIPMRDVRVRGLADRRLAGRYRFALVQRRHITGVATDQG